MSLFKFSETRGTNIERCFVRQEGTVPQPVGPPTVVEVVTVDVVADEVVKSSLFPRLKKPSLDPPPLSNLNSLLSLIRVVFALSNGAAESTTSRLLLGEEAFWRINRLLDIMACCCCILTSFDLKLLNCNCFYRCD